MSSFTSIILAIALCLLPLGVIYLLIVRPLVRESRFPLQEREQLRTRRYSIILGLILIAGGLLWFYLATFAFQTAFQAKSWPKTLGVVNTSNWERHPFGDSQQDYYITTSYQYSVDGVMYTSDHLTWSSRFGVVNTQKQSEEYGARYPPGTKLWVYYNPSRTEQSALDPGVGSRPTGIVFSTLLVAGGSFAIWWGLSHQ